MSGNENQQQQQQQQQQPPPGDQQPPPGDQQPPPPPAGKWWEKYDSIKSNQDVLGMASKYTSEEAAIMAGFNAQRLIGAEKVPIPKTDADWENWYTAAGRPKSEADYKFEAPKLPEGLEYDGELEKTFRPVAHKLGLNTKQAAGLRDWWMEQVGARYSKDVESMKADRDKGEAELRREHGQGYDGFVETAKAALKHYADEEFVNFLESSGLGNHPQIVRAFGKIGKELIGDNKIKAPDKAMGVSMADLDTQIATFRREHSAALLNKTHPDNRRLTEELAKLYQARYPEAPPKGA